MRNQVKRVLVAYIFLLIGSVIFNGSRSFGQCTVTLPKDFIECNNSAVAVANNAEYMPTYSTNQPSNTYLWTITGGPYSFFGGTSQYDRYPKINYADGYIYKIILQFTNGFGTCRDTQVVYRHVAITADIALARDTTVCNSSQSINLTGTVEGPYTSVLWASTGTGAFSSNNTLSTNYTFAPADKIKGSVDILFKANAVTNSTCFKEDWDTVTVHFIPTGAKDSSVTACSNTKLNYQPSVIPSSTQFLWTSQLLSGNASGNTMTGTGRITDSLINHSSSADAVVRYTITPYVGECTATPVTYNVTIKPKPVVTTNNASEICEGTAANFQLSSSIPGALYTWTSTVITGSVSGSSNVTTPTSISVIGDVLTNNTGSFPATVKYTVTPYTPSGCAGHPFNLFISLNPRATVSNAGSDRSICLPDTIHLDGNWPISGTGMWSQVAGPSTVIIDEVTSPSPAVSNLTGGTYSFVWTIRNGLCTPSSDTVTVSISSPHVGGMLPGTATLCSGSNSGSFTLNNYTGNINSWEYSNDEGKTWTGISNTSTSQNYNNLTATTWYRAIVERGACGLRSSDTAIASVFLPATPAIAGADRSMCLPDTIHLNAVAPANGTGSWSLFNGPNTVIIGNPSNPEAEVTDLQIGTYTFVWTVGNGICPSTSDTVNFHFSTPSIPGKLSGSTSVCADANAGNLTLSDHTGNIINWQYSIDSGETWSSINNASNNYAYNNLVTTTWYRVLVQNGGCPPEYSDTAVITVFQPVPTANAGADRALCLTDTLYLQGNATSIGTASWKQTGGPTTASIDQPESATTAITNLQPGIYSFVWTISNGVCTKSTDTVLLTILTPSIPGKLTGSASVCADGNSGNLNLNDYTGNITNWQYSINSGETWSSINNASNNYAYNNLVTTTWYRVLVQNGGCLPKLSDTVVITVLNEVTVADAGKSTHLCLQDTIHLNANNPVSGVGRWSQLSGPAMATITNVNDHATALGDVKPGLYKFEWTISNNVCKSSSDTLTIELSAPITNSIDTSTLTVCDRTTVTINNKEINVGDGSYEMDWEISGDNNTWRPIEDAHQSSYTFVADTSVYIRRVVRANPCISASAAARIIVQKRAEGNTIADNQTICEGDNSIEITGSTPTGGNGVYTYSWAKSINGGNNWTGILSAADKNLTPGAITQTTQFRRTVTTMSCQRVYSSVSNIVSITVNPHAKAAFTVATSVACAPFKIDSSTIITESQNGTNKDYTWYANNTLLGYGTAFPGYTLSQGGDSVIIRLSVSSLNSCKSDSAVYVLHTSAIPEPAFVISDSIACGSITVNIKNQTPRTSQYRYLWDFGNGETFNSSDPQPVTFHPASTTDTNYVVKLSAFNSCDTASSTHVVQVRPKPKAILTAAPSSGCSPLLVNFNASVNSSSVSRVYFDDGTDSTITGSSRFSHWYHTGINKTFAAKLVALNECGSDTSVVPVQIAAFNGKLNFDLPDTAGCAPHRVSLINHSTGTATYSWDFGEGPVASSVIRPDTIRHKYDTPGVYRVELKAYDGCGDTTVTRYVYVHASPKADFLLTQASKCIGETINVQNKSSGASAYAWNFGDGTSDTVTNPIHQYNTKGSFSIGLSAVEKYHTGVTCVDSITYPINVVDERPGELWVSDTTGNCLPYSFTFINRNQPSKLTNWSFGDGTTASGDTVIHIYNGASPVVATMTALSATGCTYRDTTRITFRNAAGALNYVAGNYCGTNNTRFTASVKNTDSLVWYFGDGSMLHTVDTVVHHSYDPGTYLPYAELIGKAGCRNIIKGGDSIRVEKLRPGFLWTVQNECSYSTVQFIDTTTSQFAIQQCEWSFGDGSNGTGRNIIHRYTNSGVYNVRLIVRGSFGCADTVVIPVDVIVHNKPKAGIVNTPGACPSLPLQFYSNTQSTDSVTTYLWDMGNGHTMYGATVIAAYSTPKNYSVRLIAGTTFGCYDTASVMLTIHPSGQVTTNKQLQICKGQQAVLQASNISRATWSDDRKVLCADCNQTTVSPVVTSKYYVAASNEFGCNSNDTVVVKVIEPFTMQTSPGDTLCINGQTNLFARGAASYLWSPSAGLNRTDISNPVAKPSVTTSYTVVGTDASGCFRDTAHVDVVVGKPSLLSLGADTAVVAGSEISLHAKVSNAPATKYLWSSVERLSCSNCPTPAITIKSDECITCTITNIYGCKTSDTLCVQTFCRNAQVFIPNAFSPDGDGVNDMFYVMGTGIKIVKSFRVFNRWGELVFEKANFAPNNSSTGWDGTIKGQKASGDVYVYICNVVCENDVQYSYKGNVAIIK